MGRGAPTMFGSMTPGITHGPISHPIRKVYNDTIFHLMFCIINTYFPFAHVLIIIDAGANVPSPRGSHTASVVGNKMYIFGSCRPLSFSYCIQYIGARFFSLCIDLTLSCPLLLPLLCYSCASYVDASCAHDVQGVTAVTDMRKGS